MNTINGRNELIAKWQKLDQLQPVNYSNQCIEGDRIFYQKQMPGQKVGKVYFKETMNGPEALLF